jgi:sulfite exporter TauE/SafE
MGLDIRWPIGLMFTLIGALLAVFGLAKATESTSLDININLIWGVVLLVFGVLMLLGAIAGKKKNPPSA